MLKFIADLDLSIINRGDLPTFVIKSRKEVLHLTLVSEDLADRIDSLTPSVSVHRTIKFSLKGWMTKTVRFRNPRRSNWE